MEAFYMQDALIKQPEWWVYSNLGEHARRFSLKSSKSNKRNCPLLYMEISSMQKRSRRATFKRDSTNTNGEITRRIFESNIC